MGRILVIDVGRMLALLFVMTQSPYVFAGDRSVKLDIKQSQAFRSWFVRIIKEQLRQGPSPRWQQRDCAGLIRFSAYESLKRHDANWLRVSGLSNRYLPPEVELRPEQTAILNRWKQIDSEARGAYASAIAIIQENSDFVAKDINQARPGDLLFYDLGEDQHLMVWMGSYVAYHTGRVSQPEDGLRSVGVKDLFNWTDSRWRPRTDNPNFSGIYRFSFLLQ